MLPRGAMRAAVSCDDALAVRRAAARGRRWLGLARLRKNNLQQHQTACHGEEEQPNEDQQGVPVAWIGRQ